MKPSTKPERLRDLTALPPALRWAAFLYLAHILVQGKITPSQITATAALFVLSWAIARGDVRPSFHILYYPLALYGIASTVSALTADMRIHSFGEGMLWIKMLVFPTALILFREVRGLKELAFKAQVIFAVAIASHGLFQFFVLDRRELENRITGPSTHVMTFSGMLLPMSLLLLVMTAYRRKAWLVAATSVVSLALLLTFTRSVWLGWAVAVFMLLAVTRPRWLTYAAAILLLFAVMMPIDLFGRLASSFDSKQSSNLDRIRMAEAGWEIIRDHPVLGVGPANVKEVYPLYRKEDAPRFRPPHLHNNVIQIWAERGIVALMAYLILLALFARECIRGWRGPAREFARGGLAALTGLTVAGLFEFNFGDTEVFYLTLGLFALVIAHLESAAEPASNEPAPDPVPTSPATLPALS